MTTRLDNMPVYAHAMFGTTRHVIKTSNIGDGAISYCGIRLSSAKSVDQTSPVCERCTYSVAYQASPSAAPAPVRRKQRSKVVTQWIVTLPDGFVCYSSTAEDGEDRATKVAGRHDGATMTCRQISESY